MTVTHEFHIDSLTADSIEHDINEILAASTEAGYREVEGPLTKAEVDEWLDQFCTKVEIRCEYIKAHLRRAGYGPADGRQHE